MGKNYRAILIVSAGLLLTAATPDAVKQAASHKEQQSVARSLDRIAQALEDENKPKADTAPCAGNASDFKSGLCAQWRAADAAQKAADWLPYEKFALLLSIGLSAVAVIYSARSFRSFRNSERAFFDFDKMFAGNIRDDGKEAVISFTILNTGRTAGTIIGGYVEPHICKKYPRRWPRPKQPSYIARRLIQESGFYTYAERLHVNSDDFSAFLRKEKTFFVDLSVVYKDAFGAKHESRVTANLVLHGDKDGRDVFRVINDPKHWHFT